MSRPFRGFHLRLDAVRGTAAHPSGPESRTRRTGIATLALLTVGIVGAGSTAASAHTGDDDRVTVTGACSSGADWKLEVKTDDGRLEVEGEVNGQTCRGVVNH